MYYLNDNNIWNINLMPIFLVTMDKMKKKNKKFTIQIKERESIQ